MVAEPSTEQPGPSYLQGFSVLCQVVFLLGPPQVSHTQEPAWSLGGHQGTEKALLGLQSEPLYSTQFTGDHRNQLYILRTVSTAGAIMPK